MALQPEVLLIDENYIKKYTWINGSVDPVLLYPAIYLSHKLDVPHHVLNVSLRDHADTPDLHTLEKVYAWQKRVLIVDDINDTGATFNYIMNNFGKPERLKFAVILHNTVSTYKDIDYKGYEINKLEDPRWIVFPWEQW